MGLLGQGIGDLDSGLTIIKRDFIEYSHGLHQALNPGTSKNTPMVCTRHFKLTFNEVFKRDSKGHSKGLHGITPRMTSRETRPTVLHCQAPYTRL